MGFFDQVAREAADPILGLNAAFAADSRPSKVNLGVGAYKTAELKPMVLSSVKKAEERLYSLDLNKEYLPITGDTVFVDHILDLIFGENSMLKAEERIFGAQSLGGTGALYIGGAFLLQEVTKTIYLSDPTWANHRPLFDRIGFNIEQYPYYNRKDSTLDFDHLKESIKAMPSGSVILLHACCHNPTGLDPTFEQWQEISSLLKQQGIIPFFDFAYQGFGVGVEEDARVVRFFVQEGHEMLVAYSCSKCFGLYGERVGALFIVSRNKEITEKVSSKVKKIIRTNYSNPPFHGAQIVKMILGVEELKHEWLAELNNMRERVVQMRKTLASGLLAKSRNRDFSFLNKQNGMFSFSGLRKDDVERLIVEYGIYMPNSGRINVAGLSLHNIDYVVDAILYSFLLFSLLSRHFSVYLYRCSISLETG